MGDAGVIETNNDAAGCKLSAVSMKYWKDDFLKSFCLDIEKVRRSPLIHRGYFARTFAFKMYVQEFLKATNGAGQVVSLGAGFDTLYFRLKQEEEVQMKGYYEVDLPQVISQKKSIIKHSRKFAKIMTGTSDYHILEGDLRKIAAISDSLHAAGFDNKAPTIIIAECVFVYLEPLVVKEIFEWAGSIPHCLIINYSPIQPHDSFGRVMARNLQSRGCALRSIDDFPSLEAYNDFAKSVGFTHATGGNMNQIYASLPKTETQRVEKIEPFDEFEEWNLINSHYCISFASRDDDDGAGLSSLVEKLLTENH